MASKRHTYRYAPLNNSGHQIRLLKFREHGEEIHCQVSVFELEAAPLYRALSYTWGPPFPNYDIHVNGKRHSIRENLYRFLRKILQRQRNNGYFWIDQLSIDQINVHERNHQVALMAEIYKRAVTMVMWLGDTVGPTYTSKGSSHVVSEPGWSLRAIGKLLRDSYFTRLWIVQEFFLSQSIEIVVAGEYPIDYRTIANVTTGASNVQLQELEVARSTLDLFASRRIKELDCGRPDLTELFEWFHGNKCIDPRDKVYGLLKLCWKNIDIPIDYNKSVQEVLLDVTMALYKSYRRTRVARSKNSGFQYEDYERSVDMLSNHSVRDSLAQSEIVFRTWIILKHRMSGVVADDKEISLVPRSANVNHRVYHRVLTILSKEMLSDRGQLRALADMLWTLWKPMKCGTYDNDGYPDFPLVTAMGFDATTKVPDSHLEVPESAEPAQARWWFECSGDVHVFECTE